jgi:post-segregation antitoxin (ccd killing protein)
MAALNIRDLGTQRKTALTKEAQARGVSVSELVRRFIDEGIERAEGDRARQAWIPDARDGLAFEAEHLATRGATLARYRRPRTES